MINSLATEKYRKRDNMKKIEPLTGRAIQRQPLSTKTTYSPLRILDIFRLRCKKNNKGSLKGKDKRYGYCKH